MPKTQLVRAYKGIVLSGTPATQPTTSAAPMETVSNRSGMMRSYYGIVAICSGIHIFQRFQVLQKLALDEIFKPWVAR